MGFFLMSLMIQVLSQELSLLDCLADELVGEINQILVVHLPLVHLTPDTTLVSPLCASEHTTSDNTKRSDRTRRKGRITGNQILSSLTIRVNRGSTRISCK